MADNHQPLPEILTRGVAEILPGASTLANLLSQKRIRIYLGIDPTGAFLTLGHAVVLRKLQQFASLGHEVFLLVGNGTVRIGDPTGRDSSRPVLSDEQIKTNFQDWQAQASKVLDFSTIQVVYNGDWLDKLTYADMVKLMAQTTVQQLLERDMFQDRIKRNLPIFGHEIMYPLLQGYDSVALNVDLEIGGTDQTFNMMMGRHLQEVYNQKQKWVLTTPIINGTDGRKMSKSFNNYIALTDPANDMYGKLMSIQDEQILEYFTLLTDEPQEQIETMRQAMAAGENPMTYKHLLAHVITSAFHSPQQAESAAQHFTQTVQQKNVPTEMPEVRVTETQLTVIELLRQCLPNESASELRRLIEQGGCEHVTNGHVFQTPSEVVDTSNPCVLRVGKRRYFRVLHG